MTPRELLERRTAPLRLVVFDCDGVLVDSEPPTNCVVAHELAALGWQMTPDEVERMFLGMTLDAMVPVIEQRLGLKVGEGWLDGLVRRLIDVFEREVEPIPGAVETLHALNEMRVPWRVASNSSHAEMAAKFRRIGIADLATGRVHSFHDVPNGKPAPDLYLAAAAAERVAPAECLVIEDSARGVAAAVAADMQCLGFAHNSDGAALRAAGAVPFHSMFELPALIEAARRLPA
jgi:HAD superfamily hydrolase (TIGR01509 family)